MKKADIKVGQDYAFYDGREYEGRAVKATVTGGPFDQRVHKRGGYGTRPATTFEITWKWSPDDEQRTRRVEARLLHEEWAPYAERRQKMALDQDARKRELAEQRWMFRIHIAPKLLGYNDLLVALGCEEDERRIPDNGYRPFCDSDLTIAQHAADLGFLVTVKNADQEEHFWTYHIVAADQSISDCLSTGANAVALPTHVLGDLTEAAKVFL